MQAISHVEANGVSGFQAQRKGARNTSYASWEHMSQSPTSAFQWQPRHPTRVEVSNPLIARPAFLAFFHHMIARHSSSIGASNVRVREEG